MTLHQEHAVWDQQLNGLIKNVYSLFYECNNLFHSETAADTREDMRRLEHITHGGTEMRRESFEVESWAARVLPEVDEWDLTE